MADLQKVQLEFGAWEPDQALLNGQQVPAAQGVIPAKRGYRPFPRIVRAQGFGRVRSRVFDAISTMDLRFRHADERQCRVA